MLFTVPYDLTLMHSILWLILAVLASSFALIFFVIRGAILVHHTGREARSANYRRICHTRLFF